jgi:hypothetical protein
MSNEGQSSSGLRKGSVVGKNYSREIIRLDSGFKESAMDRERKEEEKIRKTFRFLLEEGRWGRAMKVTVCLMLFFTLSVTVIMGALIIEKYSNKQYYEAVFNSNTKEDELIMLLTNSATHLQQLTLRSVVPSVNASDVFGKIQATANINQAMDDYVAGFELEEIRQAWPALRPSQNKTWTASSENYFQSVYDYLQAPMNNLANSYHLSDFNFPYAYDYLAAPLSTIQQQLYTFLVNAIYFAIPKFRLLHYTVTTPINDERIDRSRSTIIINIILAIIAALSLAVAIGLNFRVHKARAAVHRLVEALEG